MSRLFVRGWLLAGLVSVVGLGVAVASGGPVLADHGCAHTPWPRFTEVAPTAKRIVVEHESDPPPPHLSDRGPRDPTVAFWLRVDEVLRGSAPAALLVRRLRSGVPQLDPRTECAWFHASLGDRIAIAFRGRTDGMPERVTTVSWVDERPSHENQGIERLPLGRVRALSGHERDGSSLPADRGITPSAGTLTDIPDIGARVLGSVARSLGDAAARQACGSDAMSTPRLEPSSWPTVLVAAYRMNALEVGAFADRLGRMGEGLRRAAETRPAGIDVCVLDGRFTSSELPRALVALTGDGPPWVAFAQCHPSDIPLDYERAAPLRWPQHVISRC